MPSHCSYSRCSSASRSSARCPPPGANSIHGIVIVGVVIVAAHATSLLAWVFIFLAAVLGTMNVVGGYVVTDRMLEMFKSDKSKKSADKNEEAK